MFAVLYVRGDVGGVGFGLKELYAGQKHDEESGPPEDYPSLRWTAPELLTDKVTKLLDVHDASQAADAYRYTSLGS